VTAGLAVRSATLTAIEMFMRALCSLCPCAAKRSDLICPGGGHYSGALDGAGQPHGSGTLYRADGSEAAHGEWIRGRLRAGARDAQGRLQGVGSEWSVFGLFEGEFVDGRRSGLGVQWDTAGQVIDFGRWVNDKPVKVCRVPRSKLPIGVFLSASGQQWRVAVESVPVQRSLQSGRRKEVDCLLPAVADKAIVAGCCPCPMPLSAAVECASAPALQPKPHRPNARC
jgi:hypothetical protein